MSLRNAAANSPWKMLYHGATRSGIHNAGKAHATFSRDSEGHLRMSLDWQWLTGDQSSGRSEWVLIGEAS